MIDPQQALQALLQPAGLQQTLFPPNSRYHGIATATLLDGDGNLVIYLKRRFLPNPDALSTLYEHVVEQGDRLDNIAAAYFADAELFWRIGDANWPMRPGELTETVGKRLRITLPEGIAGMPNA